MTAFRQVSLLWTNSIGVCVGPARMYARTYLSCLSIIIAVLHAAHTSKMQLSAVPAAAVSFPWLLCCLCCRHRWLLILVHCSAVTLALQAVIDELIASALSRVSMRPSQAVVDLELAEWRVGRPAALAAVSRQVADG